MMDSAVPIGSFLAGKGVGLQARGHPQRVDQQATVRVDRGTRS